MHPDTLNNASSRGEYTNPLVQLPLGRGRQHSANTHPKTTQKMYDFVKSPLSFPTNVPQVQNATISAFDNSQSLLAHAGLARGIAA